MQITKFCILLSNSNIALMTLLREQSLKHDIELSPCRQIVEMLDLLKKGANAVLVERTVEFGNICEYVSKENKNKFFYFQDNKIFDCNNNIAFKNTESFFKSRIFKQRIKNSENTEDKISIKLNELGVVFNTWQSRCIKHIIECIAKENISINEVLSMVSICCGYGQKVMSDALRSTLKDYVERINDRNHQQNDTVKVNSMINTIYNYCFN